MRFMVYISDLTFNAPANRIIRQIPFVEAVDEADALKSVMNFTLDFIKRDICTFGDIITTKGNRITVSDRNIGITGEFEVNVYEC